MKPFYILLAVTVLVGLVTKAWAYNVPTLCDVAEELHQQPVDIDALSIAFATAETSNCRTGVGASRNNCHGIKRNGEFVTFDSPADSHRAWKAMWANSRYYAGRFPTCDEARLYTSNLNPHEWVLNVFISYFRFHQ